MTKLNFDQIVQQKLGELDIKYNSEYWNEMEEKLNSSPSSLNTNIGTSSSISSTYVIAIATIGIAALSVITFMLLNNNSNKINNDLIGDKVLIENTKPISNTKEAETKTFTETDNSIDSNNKIKISKTNPTSSNKITPKKESRSTRTNVAKAKFNDVNKDVNSDNAVEAKPVIKADSDVNIVKATNSDALNNTTDDKLAEPNTETKEKYVGEAIIVDSDSSSSSYYIKKTSYHKGKKENNGKEKINKNNDLKNVTPINKPAKRVFKKRKGGLWGLISRR